MMDFMVSNSHDDEFYTDTGDTVDTTSLKSNPHFNFGKWEISFLKKECQNLGLEHIYQTYIQRVQRSFLSIFFVLQTIINVIHVIIISSTSKQPSDLFPDIVCYTVPLLVVWISLFAAFKEDFVKKYPYVPFVASCIALFSLIIADLTIPIYHAMNTFVNPPLRVAYASHLLFVIYMFLPLKDNWLTVILGAACTGSYIMVFIYVTYEISEQTATKVITETIFLVAVNFFGIYHRLMNEIAIRRTFLDRRECVVGNLLLKFARNQENDLLLSILPDHTAQALEKDIAELLLKVRDEKRKNTIPQQVHIGKQWRGMAINKLYVEEHKDVSILYADVVNYTMMTTQLPVRTLVETLHELFVKFDEASKEYNVLRIKFLGDCYYCVAGVPVKNKRHAKSCVDLGLRMIRDIRDVRLSRNLDIDMRIGVHSGSIISGVIGACKWQYDIWSRDVNIANKMESTGCPGKVHVTSQTLALLEGEYMHEEGTEAAKKDPTLKQYNIKTYLIGPHYYLDNIFYSQEDTNPLRLSSGVKRKVGSRNLDGSPSRMNFMKNSMERYRDIMKQADIEMARELDRMPIGKFNLNKLFTTKSREPRRTPEDEDRDSISTCCLCLTPKSREIRFLQEPDNNLKYSTLMVFFVFIIIFIIQNMNKPFSWTYWTIISVSGVILFAILPITWFNRLWDLSNPDIDDPIPKNQFAYKLYKISDDLTRNALARHSIYLVSVSILVIVSFIHLVDCSSDKVAYPTIEPLPTVLTFFSRSGMNGDISTKWCLNPWSVTECLILTIGVTFLFQKIHFMLKLSIALMILFFYAWIVFGALHTMFSNSASINPTLSPNVAHFLAILFTTVIFHLIDRNSEYIAKVDYNWKQQLLRKQKEAELTKETNKILVHNILPAHVAEIYINQQMTYEFYNEEYENVAVLFATITNFDVTTDGQNEKGILNVLNEIICDFDELLLSFRGPQKIEKIKVAGWTYMAACGLDPGRGDASIAYPNNLCASSLGRSSHLSSNGRRSFKPILPAPKQSQRKSQNVVMVLAEFALNLMRVFQKFNVENFKDTSPGLLRIGISHGKVMAGVVGSSKPLYDIWGNSVNMASRMDSTGIPGKIQVTKETANVLQQYGIQCDYRGEIFVKGRGEIPTYFIRIDEELNFIRRNPNSFRPAGFETKL